MPVLLYGSENMIWREKETSRIRADQMDNFRSLLGIRRMESVPNARIRELRGVAKGVFSNGLAISKEWGMIGSLKGCMWVVA